MFHGMQLPAEGGPVDVQIVRQLGLVHRERNGAALDGQPAGCPCLRISCQLKPQKRQQLVPQGISRENVDFLHQRQVLSRQHLIQVGYKCFVEDTSVAARMERLCKRQAEHLRGAGGKK